MTGRLPRPVADLWHRVTGTSGAPGDVSAEVTRSMPPPAMGGDGPSEPMGPTAIAVRVTAVVLGALLLVAALWILRGLVLNVFLALLLTAGMLGPARRFERRMPRPAAALLVNALFVAAILLIFVIAAGPMLDAFGSFLGALPGIAAELRSWLEGVLGVSVVNEMFPPGEPVAIPWGGLLNLSLSIVVVVANLVVILIIGIFLLIERSTIVDWLVEFMDSEDRPAARYVLTQGMERLGGYLHGLLISMTFIGVATAVGMWLIGIPYALPMGLLAFVTAAIPYIGGLIALVPILLIAAVEVSPLAVVLMIVWQVVIQQIEGTFVTPMAQHRTASISPLVVMLAVTAGLTLGGLVGGIIAIPIAGLFDVVLRAIVIPTRRRNEARRLARRQAAPPAAPPVA